MFCLPKTAWPPTWDFFGEGGGEKLAQERKVPFLGRIPLETDVRKGGDYGRPSVITSPDSPAGQAFQKLAQTTAQPPSLDLHRIVNP